jgi:hypothetical protein
MATTTHTMVVELSHEVVVSFMRWLFREATTSFSLLTLLHIIKKSYVALHETTYETANVYQLPSLRDFINCMSSMPFFIFLEYYTTFSMIDFFIFFHMVCCLFTV